MRRYHNAKKRFSFAALIAFSVCIMVTAAATGQERNSLAIQTNGKGRVTAVTVTNPITSLGIEKSFLFEVNGKGRPTKGIVIFSNGVERPLNKPEELMLMWREFGCDKAVSDRRGENSADSRLTRRQ